MENSSTAFFQNEEVNYLYHAMVIATICFVIEFFLGIIGNLIVIWIISFNKEMHSTTNIYIANLAISDAAFLAICIPRMIYTFWKVEGWELGVVLCSIATTFMTMSALITCCTLTLMTIDRFLSIRYPMKALEYRRNSVALISSLIVWIGSLILCFPYFFTFGVLVDPISGYKHCTSIISFEYEMLSYGFVILIVYIIPLAIILGCYAGMLSIIWSSGRILTDDAAQKRAATQRKRRITIMVFVMVFGFAICWGPLHFVNAYNYYLRFTNSDDSVPSLFEFSVKLFSLLLAYSNSCMNPFIYALIGENFKKHLRRMLPCFSVQRQSYRSSAFHTKTQEVSFSVQLNGSRGKNATTNL